MLENQNYMITQALFKRFFIVILILFTGFLASLMYYIPSSVRSFSQDVAVDHATKTLRQFSILRQYYTDSVVQKLVADDDYQFSSDHISLENGIPLPATMIKDLSQQYQTLGMNIKLYSPYRFNQTDMVNLNPLEQSIWQRLNDSPDEVYHLSLIHI